MSDLILLDTHVLIWAVAAPQRLTRDIQSVIENNLYAVSVASLWELINKKGRSTAPVNDPAAWWDRYVVRPRTPILSIRASHVLYLDHLPWFHRDPYDRILVAQSAVEKMPLVTSDPLLESYGIEMRNAE